MFRFKQVYYFLLMCLSVTSVAAPREQFLIVPNCLLSNKFKFETIATHQELRLIKTQQFDAFQQVRTNRRADCRGFINVTAAWCQREASGDENAAHFLEKYLVESHPSDFTRSYKIKYQAPVRQLIQKINRENMSSALFELTDLPDRNANTLSGKYAAKWIIKRLTDYVSKTTADRADIFTIATVSPTKQPSIILRIGKQAEQPAVVLGAHFDTLKKIHHNQPGANDNASGAITLLETARILLASDLDFNKAIYLIWYGGREEGMLGSQSVVTHFNNEKIVVDAVLELDQTGYRKKLETGIGLSDDFTDAALTAFVADLAAAYVKIPVGAVHCGYACSDHAIWYQNGNRVAYPLSTMNDEGSPYSHTAQDTVENLSLDLMSDFVKLSLAFIVELAEVKAR